ncbi:(2Fe-2S)-binding protein [Mameliella alba]|nr:(2Fe-2S)-binding protein [Mameliella alba]MBY6170573.1 (2Fe-2S)-binding protein [Mameliella alba]MBY6175591.1 (2Fe-2S)-binding protein [Mameliella alba]
MSGWRHPELGQIDRAQPLSFRFDGATVGGYAGDTLASALLASGRRVIGRSFKYHRPRGLWGMGGEEPNALFDVTLDGVTTPNARATLTPLRDGMALASVNAPGGAARDPLRLLDLAQRFLPAGFYYKTFIAGGWMRYEPMIRRMAGLGRLDPGNRPAAATVQRTADCDPLVIGAGPAGLAAARAAASQGRAVWLVDEAARPGGSLRWRGGQIDGGPWQEFQADTLRRIEAAGGRVLTDTTLWGAFDHGMFAAWQRGSHDTHWRIRAKSVVLAAGALERPLWFANNDLPGILSAEAALHHLMLYGAVAGRRIVLGTANDGSYPVAGALAQAGCRVILLDARNEGPDAPEGVELRRGVAIEAARGAGSLGAVVAGGQHIDADTALVSGGYTPSVHLHCQAGGKLDWDARRDALLPRPGSSALVPAGAANGAFGLAQALAQGHAAGGGTGAAPNAAGAVWSLAPMRPDPKGKGRVWIDPQNDVTLKDVRIAAQEGYRSVEHLKRYTTLGMATDQGRSSNFAGLAAMSELTGRSIPETGTTTYRPPFTPVPLTALGGLRRGALFNPVKRLALEPEHAALGARFGEYGGWRRPAVYSDVQAEAKGARETLGIYDASPLGKIEVTGPGAAALLDFCGYMRMSTLQPGRARYGFMLGETGVVADDGVVLRLDETRYILSASSGHVDHARMILEEARQDIFDPSQVYLHDTTAHWVTLSVTGPAARKALAAADFPQEVTGLGHMRVVETRWQGVPLRAARVSFTGDASWELSVPARHGAALMAAVDAARAGAGGHWIGLEAVMILRAEKGYILVGKDTDGITLPQDLGWAGPRNKRQDEYYGRRSLFTPEASRPDRRQLVGLEVEGPPLPTGAHLVPLEGPRRSLGFVTSSYHSPVLNRPVALALVEGGQARMGEALGVFHLGETRSARIAGPCAFDPEGTRLAD